MRFEGEQLYSLLRYQISTGSERRISTADLFKTEFETPNVPRKLPCEYRQMLDERLIIVSQCWGFAEQFQYSVVATYLQGQDLHVGCPAVFESPGYALRYCMLEL